MVSRLASSSGGAVEVDEFFKPVESEFHKIAVIKSGVMESWLPEPITPYPLA